MARDRDVVTYRAGASDHEGFFEDPRFAFYEGWANGFAYAMAMEDEIGINQNWFYNLTPNSPPLTTEFNIAFITGKLIENYGYAYTHHVAQAIETCPVFQTLHSYLYYFKSLYGESLLKDNWLNYINFPKQSLSDLYDSTNALGQRLGDQYALYPTIVVLEHELSPYGGSWEDYPAEYDIPEDDIRRHFYGKNGLSYHTYFESSPQYLQFLFQYRYLGNTSTEQYDQAAFYYSAMEDYTWLTDTDNKLHIAQWYDLDDVNSLSPVIDLAPLPNHNGYRYNQINVTNNAIDVSGIHERASRYFRININPEEDMPMPFISSMMSWVDETDVNEELFVGLLQDYSSGDLTSFRSTSELRSNGIKLYTKDPSQCDDQLYVTVYQNGEIFSLGTCANMPEFPSGESLVEVYSTRNTDCFGWMDDYFCHYNNEEI